MFTAMRFDGETLQLIDQRLLPNQEKWIRCEDLETVATAIEDMIVRGAPAIGCAAAFGVALEANRAKGIASWRQYKDTFSQGIKRLAKTRPTAVNLFYALDAMTRAAHEFSDDLSMEQASVMLTDKARFLSDDDIRTCKQIGDHGAGIIQRPANVLTHCNTGSLATAGYGTALGIIRSMRARGNIKQVWVDETRPYLQGSRLTAFELGQDKIPYKLITDNMAAYLMRRGEVDLVVVGADRIARNGDTANKIGTYGLAVLCAHHKIPFVVAAPKATIDYKIATGEQIPVEERPARELKEVQGQLVAPADCDVWNPSFDVTPAALIHAVVTEDGVFKGPAYSFA
jgi:methylthioribose-1-phosphate isomerase